MITSSPSLTVWAQVMTESGRVDRVSHMIGTAEELPKAPEAHDFVAHRLARFASRNGLGALDDLLRAGSIDCLRRIVAVRHTWFWREPEHFVLLINHVAPLLRRGEPLRIWSAAASSGEEPYSIAMALLEAAGSRLPAVRIVATDLDAEALDVGRRGNFEDAAVAALPETLRRWLQPSADEGGAPVWQMRSQVCDLVEFQTLNLLSLSWALPDEKAGMLAEREGLFDAIFCRNVLMYFEPTYRYAVLEGLASRLAPGGLLCLGLSETAGTASHLFEACGRGAYLRRPTRARARTLEESFG